MVKKHYKPFQFKQFSISQEHAAMKVGTDSIMLGSWATVKKTDKVLDIGTGTGLLSIMLSQKVDGKCAIDAIEIDQEAIIDAKLNLRNSPWPTSIKIQKISLQEYQPANLYDLIICNPPFYMGKQSSDSARNKARNAADSLDLITLLQKSSALLRENGKLCIVIPSEIAENSKHEAKKFNLQVSKIVNVRSKPIKPVNRTLLEFKKTSKAIESIKNELCIEMENGSYSTEFKDLTRDFYLNF